MRPSRRQVPRERSAEPDDGEGGPGRYYCHAYKTRTSRLSYQPNVRTVVPNRHPLAVAISAAAAPQQYRVISTSNAVFLRDVVAVQGGVELMVALGFREDADGQLVLPMVREAGRQRAREDKNAGRQRQTGKETGRKSKPQRSRVAEFQVSMSNCGPALHPCSSCVRWCQPERRSREGKDSTTSVPKARDGALAVSPPLRLR